MASLRQIFLVALFFCPFVLAKRESEESSAAVEQTVREHSAAQAEASASADSYAGIGVFASGQLEVARTVNAALKRKFFSAPAPTPSPPPEVVEEGSGGSGTRQATVETPTQQQTQTPRETVPPAGENRESSSPTEQTPAPSGPPPATVNLEEEPKTCDNVQSQRKGWWGRTFGKSNEQQRLIEKTHKLCSEHSKLRKDAKKAADDMKEYERKLSEAKSLFHDLREDLIDNERNIARQGASLDEIVAAANKHGVLLQKMQQMQQILNGTPEHQELENADPQDHQ